MPTRSARPFTGKMEQSAKGVGQVAARKASVPKPPETLKQADPNEPEWKELLERIKASSQAESKNNLLDFLWKHRYELLSDKQVEEDFFKQNNTNSAFNPGRSRVAVGDLKKKLTEYFARERQEKWRCILPSAKTAGGYRLKFSLARKPATATDNFWNVHLNAALDPIVITGSHLFFFDKKIDRIIRYYDFNQEGNVSAKEILEKLKVAHPKCNTESLEPWHDVYLASGDVHAHGSLLEWFYKAGHILIKRVTARDITEREVHRRNPILMGRPQTNPIIQTLLSKPPQGSKFAFRIHDPKGTIRVTNVDPRDIEGLSAFPISEDGVVGPVMEMGRVFGIVHRFPNPGGRGHITIISCGHYAMVNARIVETLTNESQAKDLLERMNWPLREPLPDYFELLFTIDLSPGGLQGEGYPQLVTWRRY